MQYILPSDDYELWNNRFALWTMSSFAVFFVLVPILYKVFKGWKSTLGFTVLLLLGNNNISMFLQKIFMNLGDFEHLEWLATGYPLYTFVFFLMGILVWHIKDYEARWLLVSAVILFSICSKMQFWGNELLFFVVLVVTVSIDIKDIIPDKVNNMIVYLSRISFGVYLLHPVIFSALGILGFRDKGWIGVCSFSLIALICSIINEWFFTKLRLSIRKRIKIIGRKHSNV